MADDNWKNRAAGMQCRNCIWWVRKGGTVLGRCRALPPGTEGRPGWPATFETDWCGGFKLHEGSLAAPAAGRPAGSKLSQMTPEEQIAKIRQAKERGEIRRV